jgi:competence protein ComEA
MSKRRKMVTGCVCLLAVWLTACQSKAVFLETGEHRQSVETAETEALAEKNQSLEEKSENLIYVYVCGQVRTPGVYALTEGSRWYEAVEMAGGILPEGDVDRVNLAAVLSDGQKIYIPSTGETEHFSETADISGAAVSEPSSGAKVNINQASKEMLMTLPGIGEAKAEAIIAYRQSAGRFKSPEELMNVPGIKEGIYAKIKAMVSID